MPLNLKLKEKLRLNFGVKYFIRIIIMDNNVSINLIALNVSLNICHNQFHNNLQDKFGIFVVGACYCF